MDLAGGVLRLGLGMYCSGGAILTVLLPRPAPKTAVKQQAPTDAQLSVCGGVMGGILILRGLAS
jgi:hypothetical protein